MIAPLALALCLSWLGCDSNDPVSPDVFPFNPDTLDFDQIQSLDYGDYVQPLLAYRNVFDVDEAEPADRLDLAKNDLLALGEGRHQTNVVGCHRGTLGVQNLHIPLVGIALGAEGFCRPVVEPTVEVRHWPSPSSELL